MSRKCRQCENAPVTSDVREVRTEPNISNGNKARYPRRNVREGLGQGRQKKRSEKDEHNDENTTDEIKA